jgi:dipeptidase E
MSKLLLLSNSTMPGTSFFSWSKPWVRDFLGKETKEVVFIPYAAVTISYEVYFETVSRVMSQMGYRLKSLHDVPDKRRLIEGAEAVMVGGGNTFALLTQMYEQDLVGAVQARVASGTPYIGWSAGANLACPTIKTTNDMPVVIPSRFDALNLIPFQINPHYHELKFENQGGETRKERIEEFLLLNPGSKVVGLPEGMLISRNGNKLTLHGDGTARLFQPGKPVTALRPGTDISFLVATGEGDV